MKKIVISLLLFFLLIDVDAQLRLPQIFGDSMVLQRDRPITVWGWGEKGEKIAIKFHNQSISAVVGADGGWRVNLAKEKAGGPYRLVVKGSSLIEFKDVLVGDVWICSGQSNMELPLSNTNNSKSEIEAANYPLIRHHKIPNAVAFHPKLDTRAGNSWHTANPGQVASFSAVGYYFARNLQQELNIPIGLINTSWSGTQVETWTSGDAFVSSDEFKDLYKDIKSVNLDSVIIDKEKLLNERIQGSIPIASAVTASKEKGFNDSPSVNPNSFPSLLFNAMIHPLTSYSIKGVIWYQGERNANAGRSYQYQKAFPLMITDWRNHWKQGDFPFYFVQLSSFNYDNGNSQKGSAWAELREAQTMALSLPNTGMAVTTDIGNAKDIHPRNKLDVGKRLALIALYHSYQKKVEYSGPDFQSMSVNGKEVILSFSHNDGLRAQGQNGILTGFEIAGEDQRFYKATARISGKQVIISAPEILLPLAVRYAWADDASSSNLFNQSGLPAVPFRTDNWQSITINGKYQITGK